MEGIGYSSPWSKGLLPQAALPRLEHHLTADVVVVGAGITGITTAYLLARSGKKVVVLEKNTITSGDTNFTTAFLSYAIDLPFTVLVKKYGKSTAQKIVQALRDTVAGTESLSRREAINCDFRSTPLSLLAADVRGEETIANEAVAAHALGLPAFMLRQKFGQRYFHGVRYEENAAFNPIAYLRTLVKRAQSLGVQFFEHSEMVKYAETAQGVMCETASGKVLAKFLVVATHGNRDFAAYLRPIQTYVIAAHVPSGTLPLALLVDTAQPYHYLRVDQLGDHDRIIVGGEDRDLATIGDPLPRYDALEAYLHTIIGIAAFTISHRFSGLVYESSDGLPLIGPRHAGSHVLLATGFGGDGMVFGTLAAHLNRDIILGRANPLLPHFLPSRFVKKKGFWHGIIRSLQREKTVR